MNEYQTEQEPWWAVAALRDAERERLARVADRREAILFARRSGQSVSSIAAAAGVSRQRVYQIINEKNGTEER